MTNAEKTELISDLMEKINDLDILELMYLKGIADGLAQRKEENAEN